MAPADLGRPVAPADQVRLSRFQAVLADPADQTRLKLAPVDLAAPADLLVLVDQYCQF